jgi:hypothetical protein
MEQLQGKREFIHESKIRLEWLPEPELEFGGAGCHVNPKIGINLYGPKSLGTPRHKSEVHIGFIGEAQSISNVQKLLEESSNGVEARDVENGSLHFPGTSEDQGYRFKIITSSEITEKITVSEVESIGKLKTASDRFEATLTALEEKIAFLCNKDHPLDYIVISLTEEMYKEIRVIDTRDPYTGKERIKRDFRRALKAMGMKYNKPTQIIRDSSTGLTDGDRNIEDRATIAWNLHTGMYFKVGGLPWGPKDLTPSTCFIGISFYRPYGENEFMRASVAQAFDEHGEGMVLRGQKFAWSEGVGKSPHMPYDQAKALVAQVLGRYRQERKQMPKRVVIHKSSRFDEPETTGFREALCDISETDFVTLGMTGNFRLFRSGANPPLRGTAAQIGKHWLLYTTGYLPSIGRYPHGHVPSPLLIIDHIGDTPKEQLLKETLLLTKMNWNSANVDGAGPITMRFARLVGEILKEVPEDSEPNPKYAYYM